MTATRHIRTTIDFIIFEDNLKELLLAKKKRCHLKCCLEKDCEMLLVGRVVGK